MLRKTSLISALLFSLSTACWASGAYVGVTVGPEFGSYSQNSRITQPGNFDARDKTHLSGDGAFASLFAGYGYSHKRFYLAGEANVNVSSADFESSNIELQHGTSAQTTYKVNQTFGLSVLPGFILNQSTLFYGRLGYVYGNFKISTGDTSLKGTDQKINGFRYGVGVKQLIAKQLSAILEFNQTSYQGTNLYVADGTTKKATYITPTVSQVAIGLVYNFS